MGRYRCAFQRGDVVGKSADQIDAHIGGRVRLRRVMKNMSQDQLGVALGLTFQQVQKYEKGLNRIGAGRLYHIARILDVTPAFFYEGLPETHVGDSDPVTQARETEVTAFLSTPEGYAIIEAFGRISDVTVRRRVVDLVRAISESPA
ncbi:MAG: helix-turn-helix transcriptional regulator [Pseudomonadota bacterium]